MTNAKHVHACVRDLRIKALRRQRNEEGPEKALKNLICLREALKHYKALKTNTSTNI